jgi:hypothetical protein
MLSLLLAASPASSPTLLAATEVAAWGDSNFGATNVPAGLSNVVKVAGGGLHSLALKSDGTVAAWGYGFYGQTAVPAGLSDVVAVAGGGFHSLALKSDGTVVTWGWNFNGQTNLPAGLSNVVSISGGFVHSLALKSNGTVAAWGSNGSGQINVPIGLNNVIAIAAGYDHSLALKSDGTVVAWGYNSNGQATVPAGLGNVAAIAGGRFHSLALKTDGTVVAWGGNSSGEINVPAGLNNVVAIAAGLYHSLALKSDGTVVGWGNPSYGATPPAGLKNVTSIASGWQHSLALYTPVLPPVADAGSDKTVNEGAFVTLNGASSHDTNSPPKPLTYSWTQLSGPPVTLQNPTSANPSFTAPQVPPAGAALVFRLTVSNGATPPMTDTVTVNVGNVNIPPTAAAGTDQTVNEGSLVTLSGNGSDPDGDTLTFTWTQTAGPIVALSGADSTAPSFIAPAVSYAQGAIQLSFRLTVNDGLVNSGPSEVTIHVVNTNAPPLASAGTDQSVNELEHVTLNGSLSSDPNGDAMTYAWEQIAGEPHVVLAGTNTAEPSFTAPELDLGGTPEGTTLTFRLTTSDGELSSTSTVNVRISNVNHVPIADAGVDKTVPENTVTALDGSGSADTDGDMLSYAWEQIETGFPVTLSGDDTATPSFTTPDVGPGGAVLRFKLTVDDNYGGMATDEVVIAVTYKNRPPTANAGSDQTVEEGATTTLAGTGSDPDGNELTYVWTQASGPTVTLVNASGLTPTFTAPLVTRTGADVVLRLTVSDPYGGSHSDEVTIHVANVNHPPVAQAPASFSVIEGSAVELIGQGTDPDAEEQSQLAYQWQQTAPELGPIVQSNMVNFTAPLVTAGGNPAAAVTLTFRLTVTDPNGASTSDEADVTVTNVPHTPVAIAGGNICVNEAASVTLNGSASNDPDSDALTYAWEQLDTGVPVTLHEANTAYPYFTAPFTGPQGATLRFKLTINDGVGGVSSDIATVSVKNINNTPVITNARASLGTLWPPDHRMVPVSILDVIDTDNNASITITGVTQDEPTNGLGDGDTPVDAIISDDGASVLLRAERSGKGDGRVYRVSFTASDFEGSSSGVVKIAVPKSKKTDGATDTGISFDSTH